MRQLPDFLIDLIFWPYGSISSFLPRTANFRSTPATGHSWCPSACLKGAKRRHARDLLQPLPAKKEMLLPIEGSILVSAGRRIS
jgi:hypothetical protein